MHVDRVVDDFIDGAMRRAISLATLGLGETSPNPSVGAVILDAGGEVVGVGRTTPAGGPHAEIVALRHAAMRPGEAARGGTAVVTLEPCNHTGRTPPCVDALLTAGIARVVVGVRDPNPLAAGGLDRLRAAGVEVITGVRAPEAAHGLRFWLSAVRRGRPYVIWKYAATLDGRSAAADGTSQWITSEQARADVHELRGTVDAIIAGVGTVIADDAHLTVRRSAVDGATVDGATVDRATVDGATLGRAGVGGAAVDRATVDRATVDRAIVDRAAVDRVTVGRAAADHVGVTAPRAPLRVVVDSSGRTPENARVRDDAAPTWIATAADLGCTADGRVDLEALLKHLYADGVRGALLEGGPTLAGAFLRAGLIDEIVGYVAPKILGAGPPALSDAGVTTIGDAIDFELSDVTRLGRDVRLTAVRADRPNFVDPGFITQVLVDQGKDAD
jgi:diaminohydroxyphosphoribosylaminopyrimidine deaminase / 5-amino-6-(5-phosphoribosylamino)uracil reductase